IVSTAGEVGDRGPIRTAPGAAAVDPDIGASPIIESHGGGSRRRGEKNKEDDTFGPGRPGRIPGSDRPPPRNYNWELPHNTLPSDSWLDGSEPSSSQRL